MKIFLSIYLQQNNQLCCQAIVSKYACSLAYRRSYRWIQTFVNEVEILVNSPAVFKMNFKMEA